MSEFYSIPKIWEGQTVVCIASGCSLTDEDVETVRKAHEQGKCKAVVVNNNYLKAPWADHLHYCDYKWWEWHHHKPEFKAFQGVRTTLAQNIPDDTKRLCKGEQKGLSIMPDVINHGSNSGYQAVNIAALYGAKKIVLLGYDCSGEKQPDTSVKMHWFGDHKIKTPPSVCHIWLECWPSAKECLDEWGIEAIQASRRTKLDIFPMKSIEEALCE